jgi:N utilization substance protein A
MAALVSPGAPVSVLIDFGLGENLAEKLVESGIGTVEKLGSMTPEDLEAIQGIGPKMVEKIQEAVNAYYGQFDAAADQGEASPGEALPGDASLNEVEAAQLEASEAGPVEQEPVHTSVDVETETPEAENGVEPPDSVAPESATIKDISSSTQTPDENGEVHES